MTVSVGIISLNASKSMEDVDRAVSVLGVFLFNVCSDELEDACTYAETTAAILKDWEADERIFVGDFFDAADREHQIEHQSSTDTEEFFNCLSEQEDSTAVSHAQNRSFLLRCTQ